MTSKISKWAICVVAVLTLPLWIFPATVTIVIIAAISELYYDLFGE